MFLLIKYDGEGDGPEDAASAHEEACHGDAQGDGVDAQGAIVLGAEVGGVRRVRARRRRWGSWYVNVRVMRERFYTLKYPS